MNARILVAATMLRDEMAKAAQNAKESAQHIPQHSNGAGPQEEICPACKGTGAPSPDVVGMYGTCYKCNGTGKLRHC